MTASNRDELPELTAWVGWVLFAGVIIFVVGFFNIVEGLVALFNPGYFLVESRGLVLHIDYTVWGWVLLGFGVLLAFAGYGVMVGQTWARVVAVLLAAVNALVNLTFVAAYPLWIVLTVALDVLVIYAVVVHGREAQALKR